MSFEQQLAKLKSLLKEEEFPEAKEAEEILNRPDDLEKFDQSIIDSTPQMVGKAGPALQEIHVFFLPIWSEKEEMDQELIKKYRRVVELYNKYMENAYENFKIMKDPILSLKYKEKGYLTVLQSSLYYLSDSKKDTINKCHLIAELFASVGMKVVREKIEASAYGIDGIPLTDDDAKKYNKYFEFHIRVARKEDKNFEPLTLEETKILEETSQQLSAKFKVPVPLSFNRSKMGSSGGYQRYLNLRARGIGMENIKKMLKEVTETINSNTQFKVVKTISEYVWYDTYTQLDSGWIDF